MVKDHNHKRKVNRSIRNIIIFISIIILIVGVPLVFLNYQAKKSGMSIGEVIQRKLIKSHDTDTLFGVYPSIELVGEQIDFLAPGPLVKHSLKHP